MPIPPGRKIHWNELGDGGISDMKFLGSGEFCSVFSSTMDGGRPIAVKMLRPNKLSSPGAIRDIEFEMHLMSRIDHKHVLCCIGTSLPGVTPDRKFIALSLISVTLYDSLPPPPLPDGTSTIQRVSALKRWPLSRALKLGLELIIALNHLHEHCFTNFVLIHRDIKPKNLGIMADGRLVIFDFGISKLLKRDALATSRDGVRMTGMCGSLRYMAPEVAMSKPYNQKSEIYSFSIVLWEMVALQRPYDSVLAEQFTEKVCTQHVRPKINEKKWPPPLCALLSRCWEPSPTDRPESREVVDEMMTIVAAGYQTGKPLQVGKAQSEALKEGSETPYPTNRSVDSSGSTSRPTSADRDAAAREAVTL